MDGDHGQWIRPRENTVEALVYGMSECDGIELDLRLPEDNRLVLHHDSKTEFGEYPECLTLDELPDYVEPIDDLLEKKEFIRRWTEAASVHTRTASSNCLKDSRFSILSSRNTFL